ncbi:MULTISPECIES: hypothetical protein [Xenorhabdus]|uniref:hypothetical protein n=1 Tax=Xenorhabdus TaxID=626 RepID=UPI00064AA1E4|nr:MULTISPECIES: hypothetical protein [Xenorhabdus]KLU17183.1 hypothetical protein AAY47_01855 [Xenorhabdus griffiniae]KOP32741.1 hypothetical protein AFK69_13600 [Xenorhabdus sp. GDc328]
MRDPVETKDTLVFDVFLNADNSVREMEIFGYAIDNGGKYPLCITYKEKEGLLYWGTGEKETTTTVNLFRKIIKVGEYITCIDIYDSERAEYTYRIGDL